MFSSAAAGVSLIAAALVLVIGVSALIGFRGFKSARQETAVQQRVVLPSATPERETGGTAPVVIGGERRRTTRKRTTAPRRTSVKSRSARVKKRPARSGLSAPARRKAAAPATQAPAPQQEQPAAPSPAATTAPPADPVGEVLDNVTGAVESGKPVESVGDILLDLRDILP